MLNSKEPIEPQCKKSVKTTAKVIIIILVILSGFASLIVWGSQSEEYNYSLQELDDGIYAMYYSVHSSIPADNYEVIVLCYNDNIHTFRGNVSISFTDEDPYVHVKQYPHLSCDNKTHAYVPQGSVEYVNSVRVSK